MIIMAGRPNRWRLAVMKSVPVFDIQEDTPALNT